MLLPHAKQHTEGHPIFPHIQLKETCQAFSAIYMFQISFEGFPSLEHQACRGHEKFKHLMRGQGGHALLQPSGRFRFIEQDPIRAMVKRAWATMMRVVYCARVHFVPVVSVVLQSSMIPHPSGCDLVAGVCPFQTTQLEQLVPRGRGRGGTALT